MAPKDKTLPDFPRDYRIGLCYCCERCIGEMNLAEVQLVIATDEAEEWLIMPWQIERRLELLRERQAALLVVEAIVMTPPLVNFWRFATRA